MKSKITAAIIFFLIYAFPFRILFMETAAATGVKFVGMMLSVIIGFIVAFGIGTNEPFDRKQPLKNNAANAGDQHIRKAA